MEVWADGHAELLRDPVFGPWVDRIGPVEIDRSEEDPFVYLLRAICYQQLAGAAARTIHGRVVEALGGTVEPRNVLGTPEGELRAAGLSRNKLKAIRDLAAKIDDGTVRVDDLESQPDATVMDRLTGVWGVGEWTAQMFLMFRLRRPDVWPVGDLGVRQGWARVHGLDETPDAGVLGGAADAYRPWRSAVAWYCWRVLEVS